MVDSISTRGIQISCTKTLSSSTSMLSRYSEQLSTGKVSLNLTDYTSSNAQKLLNFNADVNQQNGFLEVIQAIKPRMEVYESSMDGIEGIAGEAFTTIAGAGTYNTESNATTQTLIEGFLSQVEYFLNQKVGDRYIYAGSRYDQAPVTDLSALLVSDSPPSELPPYLTVGNAVPAYDVDYDPMDPTAAVPTAHVHDTATIDTTKKLTYGVTSNEEGFQQLIMGLRWAHAATEDPANYSTYMTTARDLISEGLSNIRATHTDSTNAYATLKKTQDTIETKIETLETQVDNIEAVDVNEVAVKITILQAQLQASYSAVSNLINLTILKYM